MLQELSFALLIGAVASLSYALIFELKGKALLLASLGGGIAWLIYKAFPYDPEAYLLPYFVATIISSLYAEIMARLLHKPATLFQCVSMLPLVPGEGIFLTMFYLVQGQNALGLQKGGETLAIAASLALGILCVSSLAKLLPHKLASTTKKQ